MRKQILITLGLMVTFSGGLGAPSAHATSPGALEGVSSTIDSARLQEVQAWIHNAHVELGRALTRISKLPMSQREMAYRQTVDRVLRGSQNLSNEFLVRNALYRAQKVHDVLRTVPSDPKRNAFARRFLKWSLESALAAAPFEVENLQTGDVTVGTLNYQPRLQFGAYWARAMVGMSYSLPSNESHLQVLNLVMGYLFNDIVNDDKNNREFGNIANSIAAEYEDLQQLPVQRPLEKLAAVKRIREFLDEELSLIAQHLSFDCKVTPWDHKARVKRIELEALNRAILPANDEFFSHAGERVWVRVDVAREKWAQVNVVAKSLQPEHSPLVLVQLETGKVEGYSVERLASPNESHCLANGVCPGQYHHIYSSLVNAPRGQIVRVYVVAISKNRDMLLVENEGNRKTWISTGELFVNRGCIKGVCVGREVRIQQTLLSKSHFPLVRVVGVRIGEEEMQGSFAVEVLDGNSPWNESTLITAKIEDFSVISSE